MAISNSYVKLTEGEPLHSCKLCIIVLFRIVTCACILYQQVMIHDSFRCTQLDLSSGRTLNTFYTTLW